MSVWSFLGDVVGTVGKGLSYVGRGIGSMIPGLSGFLGQNEQNAVNKEMMEYQNAYNAEQSLIQYQRSIDMWNMQNEYNTPTNQLQRLRDAGLSPYLAYSNAAAGGTAGSMSPPSAIRSASMDYKSPLSALGTMFTTLVPSIQNYELNRERIKQEKTKSSVLNELLWSQVAKNNQAATYGSLKSAYQSMYNSVFGQFGASKAQFENQILGNRASATTYDKLLAQAKLNNIRMATDVLGIRKNLNQMQQDYFKEFGYGGRLDWQAGLLGQGMKGIGSLADSLLGGIGRKLLGKFGRGAASNAGYFFVPRY